MKCESDRHRQSVQPVDTSNCAHGDVPMWQLYLATYLLSCIWNQSFKKIATNVLFSVAFPSFRTVFVLCDVYTFPSLLEFSTVGVVYWQTSWHVPY